MIRVGFRRRRGEARGRLLLWRNHLGFGDWVMAATIIHLVNRQHPGVEVVVNARASGRPLPPLLREVLDGFDLRIAAFAEHRFPAFQGRYDFRSGHLLYDLRRPRHLIAGMAERFDRATGLPLRWEPGVLARWRGPLLPPPVPPPYVVMPSCGRAGLRSLRGKNWEPENFEELCRRLAGAGLTVVQVGAAGDPPLAAASARLLGRPLAEVCALLAGCSFLVCLVNGLCHLGGHLGVRAHVLYCGGPESPEKTRYPAQVPLVGVTDPAQVAAAILRAEGLRP